jgi:hypothetical protein
MQDANTKDFLWDVVESLRIITECMTLEPGDVIITGAPRRARAKPPGNPPVWMAPGDVCEIEIEGIGTLSNPIIDEQIDTQGDARDQLQTQRPIGAQHGSRGHAIAHCAGQRFSKCDGCKFGCGKAQCGACAVVSGRRQPGAQLCGPLVVSGLVAR